MKRLAMVLLLVSACHHEARTDAGATGAAESQSAAATAAAAKAGAAAAARAAEEAALGQQPAIPPLAPFDAPAPRIERLRNGLAVYLIERKGDGIESLHFAVRGGASADPADLPGLSSLTAALMETGAAGQSQVELATAADAIGASLSVGATQDALVASVSAMTTSLLPMVKLLSDVALRPTLAPGEWTRVQQQREAALIDQRSEPEVAVSRAFRSAVYGKNPLARPGEGTLASVKATTLAEVKRLYASFSPRESALIAVGGAPADEVLRALDNAFASWQPKRVKVAPPIQGAVPAERPRLVMVDFPGKPQAVVVVGQPSVPRSSPDRIALEAFNVVLGGSFTSRLEQNLREAHGYTYGAGSRFAFGRGPGPWAARSSVKTDVTGAALSEMLKEIDGAVSAPVAPAELEKARALLAYDLVETLSHADALAREVTDMFIEGTPPDELQTFVPRLQALTPASVQAATARALQPRSMTIVIAGDRAAVTPQLAPLQLPAPQLRDATGVLLQGATTLSR
jgi:zinc protease